MNPLEEIFNSREIRTWSKEEQREFELSLMPDYWEEKEIKYKFALSEQKAKETYIN